MPSIVWRPIHQKYVKESSGSGYTTADVNPSEHAEALFGTEVPGGFLLKHVSASGTQLVFVPQSEATKDFAGLWSDGGAVYPQGIPRSVFERSASDLALRLVTRK